MGGPLLMKNPQIPQIWGVPISDAVGHIGPIGRIGRLLTPLGLTLSVAPQGRFRNRGRFGASRLHAPFSVFRGWPSAAPFVVQ